MAVASSWLIGASASRDGGGGKHLLSQRGSSQSHAFRAVVGVRIVQYALTNGSHLSSATVTQNGAKLGVCERLEALAVGNETGFI